MLFLLTFLIIAGAGAPGAAARPALSALPSSLSPPDILLFNAEPNPIYVNWTSLLNATVAGGGALPFTYHYADLPPGCVSANVSSLSCTPTASALFTVEVSVTLGNSPAATATAALSVQPAVSPPPVLVSLKAEPTRLRVGTIFWLQLNVSYGEVPVKYLFEQLPAPCVSFNAQNLSCLPTHPGVYTIVGVATDKLYRSVSAEVTVTVVGNTTPSASTSGNPLEGKYAPLLVLPIVLVAAAVGWFFMARRKLKAPPPGEGPLSDPPTSTPSLAPPSESSSSASPPTDAEGSGAP